MNIVSLLLFGLVAPSLVGGCGGTTSDSNTNGNPSNAPGVSELAQVEQDSVRYVAVNDNGIYWTNVVRPGLFKVNWDATGLNQLNGDLSPDALSATADRLYWRSFVDATDVTSRLCTALDDGSQRQDLVSGPQLSMGGWAGHWSVPSDAQYIYWQSNGDATPQVAQISRVSIAGGTPELLYNSSLSGIDNTWLGSNGNVYFDDGVGIHALDLATRAQSDLVTQGLFVTDPAWIGDVFYFVGASLDVPALNGLFRLKDGVATRIGPSELVGALLRAAADNTILYLLDGHDATQSRVLRYDPASDTATTIYTFPNESPASNIVVDGDYLVFGLFNRIVRMPKNPQ